MIGAWTRNYDKHEAMSILGRAGIPAGSVLDTKELIEEPTFHSRGILQTIEHPEVEGYVMPAWPVRHDGAAISVKASPLLGEHTGDVLESWLGLDQSAVAGLVKEKVVSRRD